MSAGVPVLGLRTLLKQGTSVQLHVLKRQPEVRTADCKDGVTQQTCPGVTVPPALTPTSHLLCRARAGQAVPCWRNGVLRDASRNYLLVYHGHKLSGRVRQVEGVPKPSVWAELWSLELGHGSWTA